MKTLCRATLALCLTCLDPAFAAPLPAAPTTAPTSMHVKDVQALLDAMQIEKTLRGVAGRSRYATEAQRQGVLAKIDRTPPADIARRLAAPLARIISDDTAIEMTRFYNTPYGKQVIHDRYNSRAQIIMPGMAPVVPPEEKRERMRAAYVRASKELADAQPAIDHEALILVQQIDKEKR